MINSNTIVHGVEEKEEHFITRKRRVCFFWTVEWKEVVNSFSLGNNIFIVTEHPIHSIFLNGKEYIKNDRG